MVLLASVAYLFLAYHSQISASDTGDMGALFSDAEGKVKLDPVNQRIIIRQRFVNIDFGLLMNAEGLPKLDNKLIKFKLNLFNDVALTAVIDKTESVSAGSRSFIGHVAGIEQSSVILSVYDGIMSGNITVPGAFYQVRYAGHGVHAVYEINQSAFPPEGQPIRLDDTGNDSSRDSIPSAGDDGSRIDVMVVYTPAARSAAGGSAAMQSELSLAVSETNTGYSQSGVSQRINLVYSVEVNYTESDWSTDLSRLKGKTDGYMDEVHGLRDQYGADIVVLITEKSDNTCGLSYIMSTLSDSFESLAFCVVARNCATGYYSFAHEMGHIMGSEHDHANATGQGVYPYSFGYQSPSSAWRTIMAYNCADKSCQRINYWSNPGLQVVSTGELLGVSGTGSDAADNHRSLNNTAYTVANFRQSISSNTPPPSTPSPSGGGGESGGGGGGCFIATAAYGSYLDPHVVVLRHFRDRYLQTNKPGQYFIQWYYSNSPPIAELIRKNESLRIITRVLLTPVILAIQYSYILMFLFILSTLVIMLFFFKLGRQGYFTRKAITQIHRAS